MIRNAIVLASAVALIVGCKPEAKAPPSFVVAAAAIPNAVTIHAKDFEFAAPDTIPAGVTTITLVNEGPGIHHVQLVKLDSGKSAADLGAALKTHGPWPAWAHFASGPNVPAPGAQTVATIDLAAGNYAILCLVDFPDHIPHFAKGMIRALTVTPNAAPAPAIGAADVTLNATEYAFSTKDTVKPGLRSFDVKMSGAQPHEVALFRLAPGKTVKDLLTWGATYKGAPPATILGGVSATEPGNTVRFYAEMTPGNYVLLCFVPDAKDGKPHFVHGMLREFKVG